MHDTPQNPAAAPAPDAASTSRRAWTAPELAELPRLVKLTLQTGGAGAGAIPGAGSETGGLIF